MQVAQGQPSEIIRNKRLIDAVDAISTEVLERRQIRQDRDDAAPKYWNAVRYDRIVTMPSEQVPIRPATLCCIFMPASPRIMNDSSGRSMINIV